ncbi:MAG: dihydroorotase [Longimicrobiales bacterium]|nr:dihydroorotase [Longimicrobiales bacterium]
MSERPIVVRGGHVVDPVNAVDTVRDLLLVEGRITRVAPEIDEVPDDALEIDARGLVVTPGLIDPHVHLREPGDEHKETIASGARAAAAGGFTAVVAMPNTDPPIDTPASVGYVLAAGRRAGAARVHTTGAISIGLRGERLAEIGEMVEAGAVGITDDGHPVMDSGLMRLAMEYSLNFDIPVADHPEDLGISAGGVMNEGLVSSRLGLRGKPNGSEDIHIVRDLIVAEFTGAHLHLQHVSTAFGVEMIRQAKARGVRVSAEASPHHLLLTDAAVEGYRTEAKMNPPLRSEADRAAVQEGMIDGTLDIIATDHAPHHYDEKEQAFDDAPNGIVGLETALGLVHTHFVRTGRISLSTLVERMSAAPARAFRLDGGTLSEGAPADLTLFDPELSWTVDPSRFLSRARNTPFGGEELVGAPTMTIVEGRIVFDGR